MSSGAFGKRDFDEAMDLAREWQLDRVELTGGMSRRDDMDEKVAGVSDLDLMVHNYFPPPAKAFVLNLASEDGEVLETSRAHCRRAVDLSQAVGATHFSVHAGFAARVKPEHLGVKIPAEARTNKGRAAEIFEESVRELSAYAKERGIRILIENNVVEPGNLVDGKNPMLLLAEAPEIVEFMERMADDNLGILVDLGHANVSSNSLDFDRTEFCKMVAPYTEALHLSDNNGRRDSNKPFDKASWIVDAMRHFDPSYVVIEAYRLDRNEVEGCIEAVREAYVA
ncbi:sugar phosphate isomerase/epimerase family protein [Aurantiacibacter sp. D1-12]|uniref:sugar phosphate isomerase/epimerase family protein n=1 Tax=Aurantiacibacter sp. D1-12 TaxID=2993658 RepID=UPI00237C78CE|nr:TIM barrel protein [Aurantiacibacter sp. D1-12]MDE1466901.1 TIM barrel protein [Aurantiacibacter sp. D1-12]